ncbi:hypothetical protein GQ600_25026 [Phytophthora cactorum]|nr:hypothetical protein GQ600_25026 [Phytophthora cactorum]
MKIQRTHRRKLRFASAKDVAPVVTVKVERAPERPLKRRKRQPRPRRVSPAPTRLESGLPAATWSNIQEHFAAAKSLGEMYVFKRLPYEEITADFFSEHEHLQGCSSGPVFPIFVPSSEIYKMKVPRKRRIYDVLHVLEGMLSVGLEEKKRGYENGWDCRDWSHQAGSIRRETQDKRRLLLVLWKAAVVQHLAEMKSNSAQVMVDFRKSRRSKRTSTVEEDSALVRVFEDQAAAGKWPCLVTMTVCFLGLLFQQDYQTELIDEAPYRDVHRRVYDVVSVLVSCNMIATSPVPSSVPMEKGLRKYVRFNYDIFTDPRILFATPDSVEQWNDDTSSELMFGDIVTSLRDLKSPKPEVLEYHLVSPPLTYWQSLHDGTSSIVFSPVMQRPTLVPRQVGSYFRTVEARKRFTMRFKFTGKRCEMVPMEKNDWCDESLKQLGLYDALPAEDKIDWELNKKLQENYYPGAASAYAPVEAQPHQCWVGKVEMKSGDLECHERLDEDDMVGNTANFFC